VFRSGPCDNNYRTSGSPHPKMRSSWRLASHNPRIQCIERRSTRQRLSTCRTASSCRAVCGTQRSCHLGTWLRRRSDIHHRLVHETSSHRERRSCSRGLAVRNRSIAAKSRGASLRKHHTRMCSNCSEVVKSASLRHMGLSARTHPIWGVFARPLLTAAALSARRAIGAT
jgi:hypothetical protein